MVNKINFDNIIKQIINSNDDQLKNKFYNEFSLGKNEIYHNKRTEVKTFDEEWINTLESYFPSLNNIIQNPKSDLRYDQEVVLVEKARKINSDSVKHLASHTQNIKTIDESGMIIPKKILTTFSDIEYATYENRFIKTLIERVFHFVRRRYNTIKENVESFQRTKLILNSNFPFNNDEVDFNLNITIKEDLENKEINKYNLNLLKRVEQLNKLITGFYQSEFMKNLEKAKPIHPPIMKTQIILKNVDYHNAYLLWLFLDKYNTLAFDLDVTDESIEMDSNSLSNVENTILVNYLSLIYNQNKKDLKFDNVTNTKVKGIKKVHIHKEDLLSNPEYLTMESNVANEYYLNKLTEIYEDRVSYHKENVKLEETALKRSMRDLQSITNNIYDSYFELEPDSDIFKRLIKEENPIKEFDRLKERSYFARVIREVKEVDYNDAIRLERRLIKRMLELDSYLIEASKKQRLLTAKELKDIMLKDHTRNKMIEYDKYLRSLLELVKENREKVKEEELLAIEKINELKNKLKEEEEKYLSNYRKELNNKFNEEIKKINVNHEIQLKRVKDRFIKEERERDLKLQERIVNLNKEHSLNIKDIEQNLKQFFDNKFKEYVKDLNKELLKLKMVSEEIQMKNEFERNNILNSELYKGNLKK